MNTELLSQGGIMKLHSVEQTSHYLISVWLLVAIAISGCSPSTSDSIQRENGRLLISLNQDWQFVKADSDVAHDLPEDQWKTVALPHTWNAKDGQDGGDDYYRGTGVYKRTLKLTDELRDKKLYVHFDGATTTARVFVNGHFIGEHKGNYAAFRFDITEYINFEADNTLLVTVNNEVDDNVAPLSADFTFFGGLYRQARLIATDKTHIDALNYASSGVFWSQDKIHRDRAELSVKTRVFNEGNEDSTLIIRARLLDSDGKLAAQHQQAITIQAGGSLPVSAALQLDKPHLWQGLKDPYLYSAELSVTKDNQIIDQVRHDLGLRSFRVDKDLGFILNDEPYPLYGINRMADFPNKGTAINNEDHERDIQLILELGATGVRLGHQQRDQYVYQRASETGLAIWAEVPLINRINTSEAFSLNVEQQALELVRQNYNHSAIMFWGLFNEITLKQGPDPRPLVRSLNELVKQEDPNRLTTAAVAASGDGALNDLLATTTDVTSFNRYYGWYYGGFSDLTHFMDEARQDYPQRRVALSEFGAGASIDFHADHPQMQDHSEEYQAIYHEKYWQDLKQRPYVWGKFLWVLADFAVDNRDEGDSAGRNDKGLVTFDRKTKKDAFYWYKANWSKQDVAHIAGRRFNQRTKSNVNIKVYTNRDTLELMVNGESMGQLNADESHKLIWEKVPLLMGDNFLEIKGLDGKVADHITITRIESSDTQITSTLLGIDSQQGKIYNLPYAIPFDKLSSVLKFPQASQVTLEKGKREHLKNGDVIRVTAQDRKSVQDYTVASGALSTAKPTSASAEIASPLSIGIWNIPAMAASKANDGIITGPVNDLDQVNIWNAMGKGPHWWKVDLGAEYYIDHIAITWPQSMDSLTPGPMSYSIETARNFKQTFDNFSETYQETVDQTANTDIGVTQDKLGVSARFIRLRLHHTQTFADASVMGKYPIFGAEEISVIGGLIRSNKHSIDYQSKTLSVKGNPSIKELLQQLQTVNGVSIQLLNSQGQPLEPQQPVPKGAQLIAFDNFGQLKEHYNLQVKVL
jgi:beta-galactosidase